MSGWDTDFHGARLELWISTNAANKSISKTVFDEEGQEGLAWVKSRKVKKKGSLWLLNLKFKDTILTSSESDAFSWMDSILILRVEKPNTVFCFGYMPCLAFSGICQDTNLIALFVPNRKNTH